MSTILIENGSAVLVTGVFGVEHPMTACSGIETKGNSFPVIWVADPQQKGERIAWPVESVRLAGTLEP